MKLRTKRAVFGGILLVAVFGLVGLIFVPQQAQAAAYVPGTVNEGLKPILNLDTNNLQVGGNSVGNSTSVAAGTPLKFTTGYDKINSTLSSSDPVYVWITVDVVPGNLTCYSGAWTNQQGDAGCNTDIKRDGGDSYDGYQHTPNWCYEGDSDQKRQSGDGSAWNCGGRAYGASSVWGVGDVGGSGASKRWNFSFSVDPAHVASSGAQVCVRSHISRGGTETGPSGTHPYNPNWPSNFARAFNADQSTSYYASDHYLPGYVVAWTDQQCYKVTTNDVSGNIRYLDDIFNFSHTMPANGTGAQVNPPNKAPLVKQGYDCTDSSAGGVAGAQLNRVGNVDNGGPSANLTDDYGRILVKKVTGEPFCLYASRDVSNYNNTNTWYHLSTQMFNRDGGSPTDPYYFQVAGLYCKNALNDSNGSPLYGSDVCVRDTAGNPTFYRAAYDKGDDSNYDFTYRPVPRIKPITKTVSVGDGANVKPGDNLTYTLTLNNNQDAAMPNLSILDPLSRNFELTGYTVTATSGSSTLALCTNGIPAPVGYSCSASTNGNFSYSGTIGPQTTLTVTITGRVKPASQIGVYPTDNSCGGDANCMDFSNGLQAVTNQATYMFTGSYIDETGETTSNYHGGGPIGKTSNRTTNPIPGALTCVAKKSTAVAQPNTDTTASPTLRNVCGNNDPTYNTLDINAPGGFDYIYSVGGTGYGSGSIFTTAVQSDTTKGPVWYTVTDQNASTSGISQGNICSKAQAYNPAIATVSVGTVSGGSCWGPTNSTQGGANTSDVSVTFQNTAAVPVGQYATNTSSACYPRYWEANHPVTCLNSNTIRIKHVAEIQPYVTTQNGEVHAGGEGCSNSTNTAGTGQGAVNSNGSGKADYFITATGGITGFNSAIGAANGSYGVICRPDALTATANYSKRTTATIADVTNALTTGAGGTDCARGWDGKVVEVVGGGTQTLGNGSQMTVNCRWTLYIKNGNLAINGNIKYGSNNANPATLKANNNPSLGVVVKNNIYIYPAVRNLVGAYFAGGTINTCSNGTQTLGSAAGAFTASQCMVPLRVDGLMLANTFRFYRTVQPTSGANNSGTAKDPSNAQNSAEFIALDNRIYTATPPGFNNLGKPVSARYLGEQAPRY